MAGIIKDTLKEKVGIPTMPIEREIFDTSPRAGERLVQWLDEFIKVIVGK